MSVYYSDDLVTLHHGDCVEVMRSLPESSVDAVVTDPPYGIGFMGKAWDAQFMAETTERRRQYAGHPGTGETGGYRSAAAEAGRYDLSIKGLTSFQVWFTEVATEALRVLKPGGHLLAFGGTRTWHRLAVAIEDAGFEVRDSIAWMYGSGFPKSLDVSKAIDKAAGAEREVPRSQSADGEGYDPKGRLTGRTSATQWCESCGKSRGSQPSNCRCDTTGAPATPAAQQWQGWGTALKPAFEPIVVARKPLDGTVAENVLRHGTGALNIDGSRIGTEQRIAAFTSLAPAHGNRLGAPGTAEARRGTQGEPKIYEGRWPANVILDESQAAELDRQSGVGSSTPFAAGTKKSGGIMGSTTGKRDPMGHSDTGGASRFFYVPKANASERPRDGDTAHPTVKPLELMRYLVKLVTPPGGTVLEPFAGSGTTLEACVVEGFHVISIELTEDYLPLIVQRVSKPIEQVLW